MAAFIQHEAALYIFDAFDGAIIEAGSRIKVVLMLRNLAE